MKSKNGYEREVKGQEKKKKQEEDMFWFSIRDNRRVKEIC